MIETPPRSGQPPTATEDALPAEPVSLEAVGRLLRGLDRQQRHAVTHSEGALLVVAGPGTGKTRVVTRRIAWLIATKRARPSEILALTFTDKAADEMQSRVDRLVPYGYADTAIHTFHAFGDRLIRDHAFELGLPGEPRVLSRAEAVVFLRERLFEIGLEAYRPLGDPTRFVGALLTLFGRAKDEGIDPARYAAYAARAAETATALQATATDEAQRQLGAANVEAAGRHVELARAYERYQEALAKAGRLDFGDQVAMAVQLLRVHPEVRRAVRERYRYVLVDEFQDTNPAQLALLELVAGPTGNVTVVGDDDQSIYTFRGAAVGNLLGFERRYPGRRVIVLRRTYRSRASIVAAADRLIRHNEPGRLATQARFAKPLVAVRRARPVQVIARGFATVDAEGDWIAQEIALRLAEGADASDVAVLVRTNREAEPILRSLDSQDVPWRFSGAAGVLARPEVRELLAFLRAVAEPGSTLDLYAVATGEPYRLGGLELTAILEGARRRHRSLWEAMLELEEQPGLIRLSDGTRATLRRLLADLRVAIELSHRRPAADVLYDHLKRSGRLARLIRQGAEAEPALTAVARLFELVREQSRVVRDDRVACLVPHLDALVAAGDGPGDADDPTLEIDGVSVLTVHKAKGLEFPVVYVAGLAEGRFPGRGRRATLQLPDELCASLQGAGGVVCAPDAEERRLAYVAMTRARDELILTWPAHGAGRRAQRPSPFVREAMDEPEPGHEAPQAGARPIPQSTLESIEGHSAAPAGLEPAGGPRRTSPLRGPRQARVELSYSQLDAYVTCPKQYHFRYRLNLPAAPNHALGYGAALHAAAAAYHTSERRGRPLGEPELLAIFADNWTSEGFLSRAHEDARYAAGQDALRRFRAARLEGSDPPPTGVEVPFSVEVAGHRLRGRYDRVDARSEGVVITDYKSSDVREPARARARARESLQLAVYALAHEAETGTLPAALELHFLESGLVGRTAPEPRMLERARVRIGASAEGIEAGRFDATPGLVACGTCPFRGICPDSLA